MVDIKPSPSNPSNPLFLREADLREAIELLFFAYRDFTAGPDRILEPLGFGRAHHRVIYFVGRAPGMSVGDLLGILQITKQSLARVLKNLIDRGYVRQEHGQDDRRRRHLFLTAEGDVLERALSQTQFALLSEAFEAVGQDSVAGFSRVLQKISSTKSGG